MTKGRAVTIIPNGEGSRGFFRLRPQTGEKLYSKANRERKKKAEAVKSEAISRRTKRRMSTPKRKPVAGEGKSAIPCNLRGADSLGVNAVQNQIGQSREKYHGKAAARARYGNAEEEVYTLSPRAVGDLLIKRSFGDAAAVRKAVFGQARYRGAAVRARAQDISKAAVRTRTSRDIGGAVRRGQPCGHIRGVQAARYTPRTKKRKDAFTG